MPPNGLQGHRKCYRKPVGLREFVPALMTVLQAAAPCNQALSPLIMSRMRSVVRFKSASISANGRGGLNT